MNEATVVIIKAENIRKQLFEMCKNKHERILVNIAIDYGKAVTWYEATRKLRE